MLYNIGSKIQEELYMKILNPDRLRANIERRMAADLAEHNVSGVSLIVKQNGETIYRNCFGTTVPGGDVKTAMWHFALSSAAWVSASPPRLRARPQAALIRHSRHCSLAER